MIPTRANKRIIRLAADAIDAAAVPMLAQQIARIPDSCEIILDLEAIRFADSAGLGWLVRESRKRNGQLTLAHVSPALAACLARVPTGILTLSSIPATRIELHRPADVMDSNPSQLSVA